MYREITGYKNSEPEIRSESWLKSLFIVFIWDRHRDLIEIFVRKCKNIFKKF